MAVIGRDEKQPMELLDWDVDWAERWMPEGDSINFVDSSVRLLDGPDTPALEVVRVDNTTKLSKVWVSGGAHGSRWRVQLSCTTVFGRTREAEFDIKVKEV